MGPKVIDESLFWKLKIEEGIVNDDVFKARVVFIDSAGSEEDRSYLIQFENFASNEKRFVIKNICYSETIFMINQLGTSDNKKTKDENLRVFEEGQNALKQTGEIPPSILALIIKQQIMKKKEEYLFIKQHKLEVQEGLRRESLTMIDNQEVRGTVAVTVVKEDEPKGKNKKGDTSNLPPEPVEGKKYNTVLRERGEEWRDRVYVDDFPLDGPNLYIAISGFKDPLLPVSLIQIGVPISAIIQVCIDVSSTQVPSSLNKGNIIQIGTISEKSLKYWRVLQDLRIKAETADYFKDTAFVIFRPPYWESDTLTGRPDKIYDEMSYLIYDIQDLTRQHSNFLDKMNIISIPGDKIDNHFNSYYSPLINDIPLESVTIFSILDNILHVVCTKEKDDFSPSTFSTKSESDETDATRSRANKTKAIVKQVFNALCTTENKQYRITYGEEFENHKDPIVIKHGDFVKYPTFHLYNMNFENIVERFLYCMPLHKLWNLLKPPDDKKEAKLSFHVNMLLSCFEREDVETAELTRLMNILACRKIYNNRSSLKKRHISATSINEFKKVYLKRSVLAEPFRKVSYLGNHQTCTASTSFPSMTNSENLYSQTCDNDETQKGSDSCNIEWIFECPDISELVSAAEIEHNQPINHIIDDFEFFEDFHGICAPQILLNAFNKFNCVDYKYCEVTDSIILMFFNSHDKDGISRDEWHCSLPTPLCLQDFFDFVLEENYDWFKEEEKLYDHKLSLLKKTLSQHNSDSVGPIFCVDDVNVDMDLLMEGSLKYQDIVAVDEEETEAEITKKSDLSPSTISKSVSSRQVKKAVSKQESIDIEDTIKPFTGYDISDRRVEVYGKDSAFFSKDRTHVSTFYTYIVPQNVEYIALNIVPGDGSNSFWLHRVLGELITPEILQRCEGFRINTKDNLMINIKKKSCKKEIQGSLILLEEKNVVPQEPKKSLHRKSHTKSTGKISESVEIQPQPEEERKVFYDFSITWPNGLIIEGVYENDSSKLSHLKLFGLGPVHNAKEDSRCISTNGEIVIFNTSGDIEVLNPDGTYINITKYEKTVIPSKEPIVKKVPEKSKTKPKRDKREKSIEIQTEDIKPPEYELIIKEFSVIETDGLQQKWVDNIPYDTGKLLIRTATDYITGEVFIRRMDGTNILFNKDGLQIVTFPDKTRIISTYVEAEEEIFPEWTEEELILLKDLEALEGNNSNSDQKNKSSSKSNNNSIGTATTNTTFQDQVEEEVKGEEKEGEGYVAISLIYTIEHSLFPRVTINKYDDKISIDSPNNTSLQVDTNNNYVFTLDNQSKTVATFDGENLHISYEACHKCKSYTTCDLKIEENIPPSNVDLTEHDDTKEKPKCQWAKLTDSFWKKIEVNEEGNIMMVNEPTSRDENEQVNDNDTATKSDWKSENSLVSHGKCQEMYQAKNMKFFIMHRDLSCSELVNRSLLDEYKKACRWQPWCSINTYDTFGDHRLLHTVLSPVLITEAEKWQMESFISSKPKHLKFKDLKEPPPKKGWYHWMRPYERFEPTNALDPVVVHKLPRAFVLRTLEQQWRDHEREDYKGGKELLRAILRYRQLVESESDTILHIPIIDLRSQDEQYAFAAMQAAAHSVYKDLKNRLEDDIHLRSRAQLDITTSPLPEMGSIEGEVEDQSIDLERFLYSEREAVVKMVEKEEKDTKLQKYWKIRAEALNEEEFYLYLFREGSVPRYFLNILGGALWWEINNLTDVAITKGQRRKMTCPCDEGEGPSTSAASPSMGPYF